ncbi:hypothetical protein RCC89_11685 [Cytophagaceae bacterium ABcell3]|nr:hypothetical protein RCC89_11685 [Cytophagaceae bacterium ABcell3]
MGELEDKRREVFEKRSQISKTAGEIIEETKHLLSELHQLRVSWENGYLTDKQTVPVPIEHEAKKPKKGRK